MWQLAWGESSIHGSLLAVRLGGVVACLLCVTSVCLHRTCDTDFPSSMGCARNDDALWLYLLLLHALASAVCTAAIGTALTAAPKRQQSNRL